MHVIDSGQFEWNYVRKSKLVRLIEKIVHDQIEILLVIMIL